VNSIWTHLIKQIRLFNFNLIILYLICIKFTDHLKYYHPTRNPGWNIIIPLVTALGCHPPGTHSLFRDGWQLAASTVASISLYFISFWLYCPWSLWLFYFVGKVTCISQFLSVGPACFWSFCFIIASLSLYFVSHAAIVDSNYLLKAQSIRRRSRIPIAVCGEP
jgi:hypothetical protein